MNYYNDNDPKACAWLAELIRSGHLPPGEIDGRPVAEIRATQLRGFVQCHFFAGIGGWPYALALAGWPADRPVWTGSCPCQPFSCAGKGLGWTDPRHVWPWFRNLIGQRRPAIVFGEQVASPDGLKWLAGVRADLESAGYACGSADLCAAGVAAPHQRQRLYWVAQSGGEQEHAATTSGLHAHAGSCGAVGGLGNANEPGSQGFEQRGDGSGQRTVGAASVGCWSNYDILHMLDGKSRRVESGTQPLAHGVPGRVGLLRGYGNAIVPEVAAQFIRAYLETEK